VHHLSFLDCDVDFEPKQGDSGGSFACTHVQRPQINFGIPAAGWLHVLHCWQVPNAAGPLQARSHQGVSG
jgi:hypothetical protein